MARVSRKQQSIPAEQPDPPVRVWRTALYVRLSVEDNGKDSDSVENQIALLEGFVASHPTLNKEALFIDNGYTGTDFLRPQFNRMIEAVQSGSIDCIVVKDLSRLGRNYIETSRFVEKFCPLYGLRFIAVNENFDTHTVTSGGELSASLSNIINDYYAKDISRKVTSSLQSKMERGEYIGSYAPHGYQKDPLNKNRLIVCPETAPVIRQIFEWRAQGISYMGINRRLNEAGIPSPSQYKRDHGIETNNNKKDHVILWNKHMIISILNNTVYLGQLVQRKSSKCLYKGIPYHITGKDEWITVDGAHEPIISPELFEKVRQINMAAANKTRTNAGKYDYLPKEENIYNGKFTCGCCGRTMRLHRSISTKRDKAYFTFKCPTFEEHGAKGCFDVKMRKADLDKAVFSFIKSQLELFIDREQTLHRLLAVKKAASNWNGPMKQLRSLRQQLEKKKSFLSSLYVDLKDGLLSGEEYEHHRAVVLSDIMALETQISELSMQNVETEQQITGEMQWKSLVERYHSASELSREMVDAFIDSMSLRQDNTLEIHLKYADEFAVLLAADEKLKKEVA